MGKRSHLHGLRELEICVLLQRLLDDEGDRVLPLRPVPAMRVGRFAECTKEGADDSSRCKRLTMCGCFAFQ